MPIPSEYRDICDMLLKATNAGRVNWITKEGDFKVILPEYTFIIWSGTDEESNKEFVAVSLKLPGDRKSIDNWYVEEGDVDFEKLTELVGKARRYAHRVPEKLDSFRKLLKGLAKIGLEEDKEKDDF